MQPEITFTAFNNAAREIEAQTTKALATYKTLLIRYPKHIAILTSYGYFLELVMHNGEEAAKYHGKADEIRAREAELNNQTAAIDGRSSEGAVVSINEDGTIESVNKVLCALVAYDRMELVGRNIKSIMASPWKEKHDQFLDNYRASGEAKVVGQPARLVYAQHKTGHSFKISLSVQERRKENGEKSFIAMMNPDQKAKEGTIIINEQGTILMVNYTVTTLFGYSPVEMLRNVIFIFLLH